MSKNVTVSLPDDLLNSLQGHPILRVMNRSKLVREAIEDFLTRNFQLRSKGNNNENKEG